MLLSLACLKRYFLKFYKYWVSLCDIIRVKRSASCGQVKYSILRSPWSWWTCLDILKNDLFLTTGWIYWENCCQHTWILEKSDWNFEHGAKKEHCQLYALESYQSFHWIYEQSSQRCYWRICQKHYWKDRNHTKVNKTNNQLITQPSGHYWYWVHIWIQPRGNYSFLKVENVEIFTYRVSHIEMVETKWLWGVVELRILLNYGV